MWRRIHKCLPLYLFLLTVPATFFRACQGMQVQLCWRASCRSRELLGEAFLMCPGYTSLGFVSFWLVPSFAWVLIAPIVGASCWGSWTWRSWKTEDLWEFSWQLELENAEMCYPIYKAWKFSPGSLRRNSWQLRMWWCSLLVCFQAVKTDWFSIASRNFDSKWVSELTTLCVGMPHSAC